MDEMLVIESPALIGYLPYKRLLDVTAALILIIILAPLLLLIALLIRIDTPGPALFIQRRAGCTPFQSGGHTAWVIRPFRMLKFRSMLHNADEALHQEHIRAYVENVSEPPSLKTPHDPRVTRIGRLLRKTSLDELPQLWNVLIGEMSLVGPRPIPLYEFETYTPEACQRFAALPGITGLWQVRGRCELTFAEQIALDIEYTRTQSFWLDLKILLLTIPAVVRRRGAE